MQINPNIQYGHNNVSTSKSQNFTSRKPVIRKLSDINMLTMREFPVHSNTRIERYYAVNGIENETMLYIKNRVMNYIEGLIDESRGFLNQHGHNGVNWFSSLDIMKKTKIGNCGELANAGCTACKLNGFQNVKYMLLYAYNPKTKVLRNLDHTTVGIDFKKAKKMRVEKYKNVNGEEQELSKVKEIKISNGEVTLFSRDKKAMIMDPWAGFTDYESNASFKYKHDNFSRFSIESDEVICYAEVPINYSENSLLYLEHLYPNLVQKKSNSFSKRLRWRLMDKTRYLTPSFPEYLKENYRTNAHFKNALSRKELSEYVNKSTLEEKAKQQNNQEIKNNLFRSLIYNWTLKQ